MLIRNYGLFWRLDKVDWGSQGRGAAGTLLGKHAKQRSENEVDFREQQGVYVLYDNTFKIIYVGQSGTGNQKLYNRLRGHRRDHLSERWSRFSWFGINPVEKGMVKTSYKSGPQSVPVTLNHIEAILIAVSEPPLNLQSGRFGENVEKYLQHQVGSKDAADDV